MASTEIYFSELVLDSLTKAVRVSGGCEAGILPATGLPFLQAASSEPVV